MRSTRLFFPALVPCYFLYNVKFTCHTNSSLVLPSLYPVLRPLLKSDTTIQRYTEPEPELEPCINYANYCLQSPQETSVIIFSGGRAHIPKNISYKVKMRKVIVCKAPLHQMIACPCLID